MKKSIFDLPRAILAMVAMSVVPASCCFAQDTEKEVVVPLKDTAAVQQSASGNITEITPDAMFIKAAGDEHPQAYIINANTTYVDDQGAPTQKAKAKIGRAVIIAYVVQGDTRVALKVVVRNAP